MGWLWYFALWGLCTVVGAVFVGKLLKHASESRPAPDDERDDL